MYRFYAAGVVEDSFCDSGLAGVNMSLLIVSASRNNYRLNQ